jgi:hypothetical protein
MTWLRRSTLLGLAVLSLGVAAGCDRSGPTVSGRVSYRGTPLTNGGVMFHGADGSTAYGGIGPDGSYAVTGAPKGPVRISVNVPVSTPPLPRLAKSTPRVSAAAQAVTIPTKYGRAESSGLTLVVEAGTGHHDINLP